jgi:hypothetical protein
MTDEMSQMSGSPGRPADGMTDARASVDHALGWLRTAHDVLRLNEEPALAARVKTSTDQLTEVRRDLDHARR